MDFFALVVYCAALFGLCLASCPHEEPGLVKFSEKFSGNLENEDITIQEPTLLDVPEVTVKRITVSADGKLVFGRGLDITLRAKAITIKERGQFLIGNEDCRHTDKVNIILQGIKSTNPDIVGPEGEEKYIMVQDQGVLKIHGAKKLAWTKINQTVERFDYFIDDPTKTKFAHKKSPYLNVRSSKRGLAAYIVNADLSIASYDVVDLYNRNNVAKEQEQVDALTAKLDALQDGQLVAIAVQKFLHPAKRTDLTGLYDKIEEVAGIPKGSLYLRTSPKYYACNVMFIKGGSYSQDVDQPISKKTTTAESTLDVGDYKVTSFSFIDPESTFRSYIDFRIVHKSIGYPIVNVIHDITTWQKGDEVLLTSTDYEAKHAEVRKIKDILSSHQVVLSGEFVYRHFGEIEHRVDMRCEMAILTRNIKIQGEVQEECPAENGNCGKIGFDSFGGHIKIHHSFGEVYIQGVEVTLMGQLGVKGRYPIHFHMCKNITGKTAILESNSIHHTFQRAITVHGTFGTSLKNHGVLLENNVAYHVYGHTFFLEDGAEFATIFRYNLGALTMNVKTGFFVTDEIEAATYWITNPEVLMIGNVAAGSQGGVGIWYTFPKQPVGPSAGLKYGPYEAYRTPIWTCDNNIVHSNKKGGFHMEKMVLNDRGVIGEHFSYIPREDPKNETSQPVKVQIMRLTAYKNKDRNAWIRGGARFMQLSSAESEMGLALARASFEQEQYASKCIFIGVSEKNGEAEDYPDAYSPRQVEYHAGIVYIYGPQHISHAWFTGFKSYSDGTYVAGGIGFKRKSEFPVSQMSTIRDFRFGFTDPDEGNRVFVGGIPNKNLKFENFDGNELAAFRDIDGSVYGCDQLPIDGPKQFVKPEKFTLTDNCLCRKNWQMCICNDLYGSTRVVPTKVWSGSIGSFNRSIISRRIMYTDTGLEDVAYENHFASAHTPPRSLMVLGDKKYYYEIEMAHGFPRIINIGVDGIELNRDVVVGICLPAGKKREDFSLRGKSSDIPIKNEDFIMGNSLEDVRNDLSGKTIYLTGRMIYVHYTSKAVRDHLYDVNKCNPMECPLFELTMLKELTYTKCFNPTEAELSTDYMPELVDELTCTYPAQTYEPDWGVGDTTASHDGAWSDWSRWSSCTSSTRSRTRLCDSPTPFGDGKTCTGETSESEDC